MTVPSQYKGFSKLPEHVQQKMDPELAKKYNMGGGVLQRPLFRQMGGPAEAMQPAPMPAPPPPPPPIPPQGDPMVQQTEAQFANIGEQLAQDTMRNIDQAQDIEGAINGLRGNEKPIEARYDELAGFVGQSDAQQTPESVLAMVQPTIMMTEQGAMDSGIGELIQSIAGSDMETPTGEPTPMGQGVGELMAMGAGNTPPVNFNQGGPVEVRRYALGDPQGVVSRATQLQSEFLPLFQQILGTEADRQAELDEIKRMQRSQAAFDVARAGLALASPTDRPMSFVEKLAAAATPLTTSLQQRGDIIQKAELAQKAQDRQAETSALTAALGQAQAEQKMEAEKERLKIKSDADLKKEELKSKASFSKTSIGKNYIFKDSDGNVLYTGPMANFGQQEALLKMYPTAVSIKEEKEPKKFEPITFVNPNNSADVRIIDSNNTSPENKKLINETINAKNPDGSQKYYESGKTPKPLETDIKTVVNKDDVKDVISLNLKDPNQLKTYNDLIQDGNYINVQVPSLKDLQEDDSVNLGSSYKAKFISYISNPETLKQYADNTLDPTIANTINTFITNETQLKPIYDDENKIAGMAPGFRLPPNVLEAIEARSKISGATLPIVGEGKITAGPIEIASPDERNDKITFKEDGTIDFSSIEKLPTFIITGKDLTQAQGLKSGIIRGISYFASQIKDFTGLGSGYAGQTGKITSQVDTQLDSLARKIMQVARAGSKGKVFSLDVTLLNQEVEKFKPGAFKTDNAARDQLVTLRNNLTMMYSDANTILKVPEAYSAQMVNNARASKNEVIQLLAETTAAIAIYDRYIQGDTIQDTLKDRAITSSITRSLPRASQTETEDE
mgnify:FL=1